MTKAEAVRMSKTQLERIERDPRTSWADQAIASRELNARALGYRRNR